MLIRLAAPTGEIADILDKPDDVSDKAVRSAILIHSGPEGESNELSASNGDISFDEDRIRDVITSHNRMISDMAVQYGGFDKTPVGAYPPVLDQHNDDSNDRIRGRLTGLLKFERRDVPKVGRNVACAVADITFLGNDTVSKVKNGLIYHLSVGINEDSNTLGEVSCVIEPAAPGAMVLKKKTSNAPLAKIKNKLKGATVNKIDFAELKKASGELKKLAVKTKANRERVQLAKRKIEVKTKFTKLMSDKKLTPAEFKKLDLVKLAKLDIDTFDTVVHAYDVRESQIISGQQGSLSASNFSDVTVGTNEDREVKRLKLAAKKNLAKSGLKFKAPENPDEDEPVVADRKELSLPSLDNQIEQPVDQPDNEEGVQDNEELVQQVEENATQIARVASMVESIIEKMQGPDESGGDESEDAEMSANDDDKESDDKKELSDDDKKDDDKKELSDDDKKEGTK